MPVLAPTSTDNTAPPADTSGIPAPTEPTSDTGGPSRELRWWWLLVAAVAVGAVVVGGGLLLDGDDAVDVEPEATIRAVSAEQRDLVEFTDLDGTLRYASIESLTASTSGTVTAVASDGDLLERGDQIYAIDTEPVVILYGDIPMYRSLSEGATGDDVEMLEANLASLGHHAEEDEDGEEIDTGFVVDGVFDAATTEAVIRWQEDLGVAATGTVALGSLLVTDGPVIVSSVATDVGRTVQPGSPIVDLNDVGSISTAHAEHTGEITLVAGSGPVASGTVLYTVDEIPVIAIVTDEPMDRTLFDGVEDGDDVLVLEELLVAGGYDAGGDLEVDETFDEFTTEAVTEWQEDLQDTYEDLVVDGIVEPADVIALAPGTRIDMVTERTSENVATGSELFSWSETTGRIVATSIEVADQDRLAEGTSVDVEFPDGTVVTGTVTSVATASVVDPTDPDGTAFLSVEISLSQIPESADGLNELDVDVKLVDDLAAGATVVPASALVATADGGFAVEVVQGTGTQFVAVDPGMFADGFVEVTGIEPGTAVVVPS